jgi:hypothetical protein
LAGWAGGWARTSFPVFLSDPSPQGKRRERRKRRRRRREKQETELEEGPGTIRTSKVCIPTSYRKVFFLLFQVFIKIHNY